MKKTELLRALQTEIRRHDFRTDSRLNVSVSKALGNAILETKRLSGVSLGGIDTVGAGEILRR